MKGHVFLTLFLMVVVSKSSLHSADLNWQGVYEKCVSPSSVYRLWLMDNQTYLLALYEKNKITLDSGQFTFNKRRISFKSLINRNAASVKLHQKIYFAKNGLYEGKTVFSRELSWNKIYDKSIPWLYNPVANELFAKGEYYMNGKKPVYIKYTKAQKNKIVRAQLDSVYKIEEAQNKRSEELLIIQETKKSYLETIKEYLPEYYSIMCEYYCGPGYFEEVSNGAAYHPGLDSVFSWGYGNYEAFRMKFLNTTIHETVHKARYEIDVKRKKTNSEQAFIDR